ncbi:hypothetical protein CPB83DRAFT_837132 [Crepidotus variabilis]|uniref:Uncharacterized protein n=1 Tax=Crepidotus variabilis TaxID=179855 RepID=A0A9P6JNP3_9AGAR|nr:hypothetical protein CPB83DRAFT_837132 [Crepidotus variabilis]
MISNRIGKMISKIITNIWLNVILKSNSFSDRDPGTPVCPKRIRKTTGADALANMTTSIKNFTSTFSAAIGPAPSTVEPFSVQLEAAVAFATKHEKKWLSGRHLIRFIEFLRKDESAVTAYKGMQAIEAVQKLWVQTCLEDLGFIVANPSGDNGLFEH